MDVEDIKIKVQKAIFPLKSANADFYGGKRTRSGRDLPEHFLVYFLLVDLLGFRSLGKGEKIAWSLPVDLCGQLLHIEHRKLGLGVFAPGDPNSETAAEESEAAAGKVVQLVEKGLRIARPYLDWRAEQAVKDSKVNVRNRSVELYHRFEFLTEEYKSKLSEAEGRTREPRARTPASARVNCRIPDYRRLREANWLALSAIESFFSWTEHVFILLAIMQGRCSTGKSVNELAKADWKEKFRAALDINDPEIKQYYDDLIAVRDQVRNFVAHGSFGKRGEAFLFHSAVGAVPVLLPHPEGRHSNRFSQKGSVLTERRAMSSIENFIEHIRTGPLASAWMYLDSGMNLVLTRARGGYYKDAIQSPDTMKELVEVETYIADAYADMDWFLLPW